MRTITVLGLAAAALLSGCGDQAAQEGAANNALMPSAETRTGGEEPDTGAALAVADAETARRLMHERHEGMEEIGDSVKRISNQLKSSEPNVGAIRQSAARILALAPKVQTWFPRGTGPDVGKTRAKAEIWQTPDDFDTKAHDFLRAAEDFDSAAKSGDLGQIQASFATLGKACKACHDRYRAPEKD